MKKVLMFTCLSCLYFTSKAQQSSESSYYPLTKGLSKTLTWHNSKYREVIKDTVTFEGKVYTHISQIFPPNDPVDIYIRKSNDTIYFFNEVKKTDSPFFGINPTVGEKIGKGTVKKINAKLKTPEGTLTDLLVISMKYTKGNKDTRYYKRGLGLVAVKNKKGLICWYVPDK